MLEKENTVRPRGTDSAEIIQVIKTVSLIGRGTGEDPCRNLIQYWTLEGELLAEHDTLDDTED